MFVVCVCRSNCVCLLFVYVDRIVYVCCVNRIVFVVYVNRIVFVVYVNRIVLVVHVSRFVLVVSCCVCQSICLLFWCAWAATVLAKTPQTLHNNHNKSITMVIPPQLWSVCGSTV